MGTRHFYFWCERCPTRITVDTDVPASSEYPDPEYTFATDGVALFQARPAKIGDDGLEIADRCPACGGLLCDLDDMLISGVAPVVANSMETAELHKRWIALRDNAVILGLDPAQCDGVYPRTRDGRCQGCGVVGEHPEPERSE